MANGSPKVAPNLKPAEQEPGPFALWRTCPGSCANFNTNPNTPKRSIMPTRLLREGILTSERVNRLSERAELFYRRLMSVADDYGRFHAHQTLLRAYCYPMRLNTVSEADVAGMLKECVDTGLLRVYGDGRYLEIVKFGQRTRTPSKFPEPTPAHLPGLPGNGQQTARSLLAH